MRNALLSHADWPLKCFANAISTTYFACIRIRCVVYCFNLSIIYLPFTFYTKIKRQWMRENTSYNGNCRIRRYCSPVDRYTVEQGKRVNRLTLSRERKNVASRCSCKIPISHATPRGMSATTCSTEWTKEKINEGNIPYYSCVRGVWPQLHSMQQTKNATMGLHSVTEISLSFFFRLTWAARLYGHSVVVLLRCERN